MKTYSTIRNTGLAAVLVATLAGLVTNGLALDQRIVYERDVLGITATVLPEIVVVATRLEP
jgi:DMSO/TMAO reductase YedYZ heme-binding membrane subunit